MARPGVKSHVQSCAGTACIALVGKLLIVYERAVSYRLRIKLGAEIHLHVGTLLVYVDIHRLGDNPALDTSVGSQFYMGVAHLSAFTHAGTDVEYKIGSLSGRICITVEAYAGSRGKFSLHAVILEQHGVIARTRGLILTVKA